MMKKLKSMITDNRRTKRKVLCLMMILTLCMGVVFSGCSPAKSADKKKLIAKLYYVNDEYVATGNEELNEMMPAYEKNLEVTVEEQYVAVLEALKVVPAEGYDTMVSNDIVVNNVTVTDDNQAIVDFSGQDLEGSSLEEGLLVHQIVRSLVDTFKVETVTFTVDGKSTGTIMGHLDTDAPFCVMVDENGRDVVVPVSGDAPKGNPGGATDEE